MIVNGDGGDTVNFPSAMINLGAGTANIGTTGGQPIQSINFTGGGLQTTGSVFLTAGGVISNSTVPVEIVALNLVAVSPGGVNLDTTVTNLEASGGVDIQETDTLTIGGIGGVLGVSATGGNISIVAVGNIMNRSTIPAAAMLSSPTSVAAEVELIPNPRRLKTCRILVLPAHSSV